MDSQALVSSITKVTKKWTKQRKAEERESSRIFNRRSAMIRVRRITITDAAWRVMKDAYMKASSNNTLPAHARQIMYAARGEIQRITGKPLGDQYFTQTLLPDYLKANARETADWDVVFDARGHFTEPHTQTEVPLGTLDVRDYLRNAHGQPVGYGAPTLDQLIKLYPTKGHKSRYSAVLFIEKEGFMPLFKAVNLAERFDIAIMSTKGMSVTAARHLVDNICQDIPRY